jgi:hypothetical protein
MDAMTDFRAPPAGLLAQQITLPDHRLALGIVAIKGAGVRVAKWDGEHLGHMSPAKARRFAREMAAGPYGAELRPVIEALDLLADKADAIAAREARRGETVH